MTISTDWQATGRGLGLCVDSLAHATRAHTVLESPSAEAPSAAEWNALEGIYAFAAWLTTRPGVLRIGADCQTAPIVALIQAFSDRHHLAPTRDGWQDAIVPAPEPPV